MSKAGLNLCDILIIVLKGLYFPFAVPLFQKKRWNNLKDQLSGLRQSLATESPLKT